MKESDFTISTAEDRALRIVRPFDEISLTELVAGCESHLVFSENLTISFLTMKKNSVFELHSHPQEQIMIVVKGYCDEIIGDKIYRVNEGDVIFLPSNIPHGAFLRDVDCVAIDVFTPYRDDFLEKFRKQNPDVKIKFIDS